MIRNYTCLLLLLSGIALSWSQTTNITGLVVIDFKNENAEDVSVTNRNTGKSVLTDLSGAFSIPASVGDTLHFDAPFLLERNFVINKKAIQLNPLVVHMNVEVIELDGLVYKKALTGHLKDDIKTVKIDDRVEQIYKNLGISIKNLDIEPKEKKAPIVPAITSLDIESLYKSISGYYRRMENLYKYESRETVLTEIKEYYGEKYFIQILGVPEAEIRNFIFFVYETSDLESIYTLKNYFSISLLLESKSKEYNQRLKKRDTIRLKRKKGLSPIRTERISEIETKTN